MNEQEFSRRLEVLLPRLYRIALVWFASESTAADVTDEAVYRAWCALPKLREPQYFETWLTRILINECHREQRRRRRLVPLEEAMEVQAEALDYLPLKEAIGKLPEKLKEVILLRYFAGLTREETARALSLPSTTVLSYQRRALKLLRLELEEEE